MSARLHHLRIGLFVLSGAALLVGALFAIGLRAYLGKGDTFETYVTGKVENLSVGALVVLRGVTIGKVSLIDFIGTEYPEYKQQYVLIQFEVPKVTVWSAETGDVQQVLDREAARGLRARVQAQGLVGASILALEYVDPKVYPVEPIPWTPKHYYVPSAPSQFNRVMASLERSLGRVQDLDFAGLSDRAKALLDAAHHLAGSVDQVNFGPVGTNAESLILEFHEAARGLQRAISDGQNAIHGADLPALSHDTAALVAKLSSATRELAACPGQPGHGRAERFAGQYPGGGRRVDRVNPPVGAAPLFGAVQQASQPGVPNGQAPQKMNRLVPMLLTIVVLGGCTFGPEWKGQVFAFSLPADPPAPNEPADVVALNRVAISPLFHSRSFTYRIAENTYEQDPYAGFLIPPERALAEAIRGWMRASGAFGRVVEPGSSLAPTLVAEISVHELYGDFRQASQPAGVMEIRFLFYELKDGTPGRVMMDRVSARQAPLSRKKPDALMTAWNIDLREIMEEIQSEYAKANPHR